MKINDKIKLKNTNLKGYLIEITDKTVILNINNKKITTNIDNIELCNENTTNSYSNRVHNSLNLANYINNFNTELMLRHKTKDESMFELENFLIEAYSLNIPRVKIVHGKQGGILRQAVHDYLRHCKYIKSFSLGNYYEGQYGVTVVEMDV